jgi:predicted nucleic acid-binding protein
MIHLDTSVLVASLTGARLAAPTLRTFIHDGIRLGISTVVLYEWLRGPRDADELAAQEIFVPRAAVAPFGLEEARLAADLYKKVPRPRGREIDLAIAACAIVNGASLWTINARDFRDVPGLILAE